MANKEDLTVEEWEDYLYENFPQSTGAGYHNLNVALKEPVSQFFFEFLGRQDPNYHDNPSEIAIYATNDEGLFNDVRDSNTKDWTKVGEITEGVPKEMMSVPYTSPMIELGGEYKYIRFVIMNTYTNYEGSDPVIGTSRTYAHPEITGLAWNCAEFQLYTGLDPEYEPEGNNAKAAGAGLPCPLEQGSDLQIAIFEHSDWSDWVSGPSYGSEEDLDQDCPSGAFLEPEPDSAYKSDKNAGLGRG